MSEFLTSEKRYNPIFSILYIILSMLSVFIPASGLLASMPLLSLVCGLPGLLVTMFCFYAMMISSGGNAKTGYVCFLIAMISAPVAGIVFSAPETALYSLLDLIAATLSAALIYSCSENKTNRSTVCTYCAYVFFIFSMVESAISLYLGAMSVGKTFGKFLFEGIEDLINVSVSMMLQTINDVAAASGQAIVPDPTMPEIWTAQLTTMIALTPAIIFISFFFVMFIFTYISDVLCKKTGLSENNRFSEYEVSSIAQLIFNITGIIVMLSLLFESEMSAFTFGVLCVFLTVMPSYIILGYRRLFKLFSKDRSALFGVFLLLVVTVIGLIMLSTLFILALLMFGTSEARAAKQKKDTQ